MACFCLSQRSRCRLRRVRTPLRGSALLCAKLFQLEPEERKSGGYGYNALLCGLGIGHTCVVGPGSLALAVVCGALCTVVAAGLRASIGRPHLPMLSIPFIIVYHLVLAVVEPAGLKAPPVTELVDSDGPALLRALARCSFAPCRGWRHRAVLVILVHSWISAMLAAMGFAVAYLFGIYFWDFPSKPSSLS